MSGRVVHALNCMVVRPVTDSSAYLSVRQCMMHGVLALSGS